MQQNGGCALRKEVMFLLHFHTFKTNITFYFLSFSFFMESAYSSKF